MSDVHHPSSHDKSFGGLLLEVVLIGVAVFLGLLVDNWREERQHREQARHALENFRAEVMTNLEQVKSRRDYHAELGKRLQAFNSIDGPKNREKFREAITFSGIHPIPFEHTAWELAIATPALGYIDPELAFQISRVYTAQRSLEGLQSGFVQAIQGPGAISAEDTSPLAISLELYFGDVNSAEPQLLKSYETLSPELNLALGAESTASKDREHD